MLPGAHQRPGQQVSDSGLAYSVDALEQKSPGDEFCRGQDCLKDADSAILADNRIPRLGSLGCEIQLTSPQMLCHPDREERTACAAQSECNDRYRVPGTLVLYHQFGDDHTLENQGHIGDGSPEIQTLGKSAKIGRDEKEGEEFRGEE